MNPYAATLSARFRTLMQYRGAALAGIVTQIFWGLLRVMIFTAFYESNSQIQPMSLAQTTGYLWLCQAFLILVMVGPDPEIAAMIRTGNVAYDLIRPVDLYNYWLARSFSSRAAPMLLRAVPILLIAALINQLHAPATLARAGLFLLSISLGLILASVLFAAITVSLLWTVSGEGAARIGPALIFFLSGMIIPLPLLPNFAQPMLRALPFRGLIDVPFRIYLGQLPPHEIAAGIAQQLLWIVLLAILGRLLLARGLKHIVAQGG